MCFSAGASFGASAVVAVAGVISIRRITYKEQIMFAAIPLIFALQQLTEGLVWITFTESEYRQWQNLPVIMFLFLAQVVWPIWVPLSILKIEEKYRHRIALRILVYGSFIVAPLQAYRLFFLPWTAEVTNHHIHYGLDFSIPYFGLLLNILYFLTTIVPPFLSSRKPVIVLGTLNLASFITTTILFERNVISVWCFFAALISWQVIRAMKDESHFPKLEVLR
ncbi:MAG TPA: DUF6629 family protein [Chryseolinea sp.]|nr:DUF6629 family protein [Chryseolinea sp.]